MLLKCAKTVMVGGQRRLPLDNAMYFLSLPNYMIRGASRIILVVWVWCSSCYGLELGSHY